MVWVILLIAGLCLGSFVNALVWRVHEQAELKARKAKSLGKKLRELSIASGRSMCPHCEHTLAVKDLVPVLSWLTLKGKCRYCKKPIGWHYPAVELLTAGLVVLSYAVWPYADNGWAAPEIVAFITWVLLLVGFMALTAYDMRWYLLPDRIVAPLTGLGAIFVLSNALANDAPEKVLLGNVVGALVIAGLFYALYQLSGGRWIGGGDVKLALLLGLLAGGTIEAFLLLFIASIGGTLYSLVLGITGKQKLSRRLRIPFGPFLLVAAYITVLWGEQILDWYTGLFISV